MAGTAPADAKGVAATISWHSTAVANAEVPYEIYLSIQSVFWMRIFFAFV